ncbi:hypothetical protein GF378_01075 [Candidatus Pacearchaeota archaeon]|nr:hypothetical protein [Candidatus Pacearchaeota archaeon]
MEPDKENKDNDSKPVDDKPKMAKTKLNPWMIASIILGIIVIVLLFSGFSITGGVINNGDISKEEAGQQILDFANSQTGGGVELVEVSENYGLYEVIVSFQGQELPLYITKDGEALVQGVMPMDSVSGDSETQDTQTQDQQDQNVPKSDKPEVELFIMTHCPYGTQAEKGFLPAIATLGNSVDAKIRFVHYFMHQPEETETPIQVCIREEQSSKFYDYLECFLEDGNSSRCVEKVGIDKEALDSCVKNTADEYYAIDSEASEGYGVRGSPTLVINGQTVSSGRSPDAMLQTICSAFNTAPNVCDNQLETASPSPGFGYEGTGSNTQAQC